VFPREYRRALDDQKKEAEQLKELEATTPTFTIEGVAGDDEDNVEDKSV